MESHQKEEDYNGKKAEIESIPEFDSTFTFQLLEILLKANEQLIFRSFFYLFKRYKSIPGLLTFEGK